ncbi:MAG: LysR family pca operon transcriptional activator [Sulfitobacter sp.]|jgi:LysR family transcriptional regulator, pca operon transcriptional activator
MDRRIKFRHLEAFIAIARAKRFNRAAEQLNLTQPTLSKTLKDLEDILEVTLLVRDRAGVSLTPEGHVLLQFAEQSTAALQAGLNNLANLGAAGGAVLTIGALPSVAALILPLATERYLKMSPDTVIRMEEGSHAGLTNRLRSGELDLVVGRLGQPASMEGLSFTQLYNEKIVAVVAPDHPLRDVTQLAQLSDAMVVYPAQDSAIRPLIARTMIAGGLPIFENRIETVSGAFGRAMALGEMRAVWFISHGVVINDLAEGRLVALNIDLGATKGPVGIMARSEEAAGSHVHLFRQSLLDAAQGMTTSPDEGHFFGID